MKKIYQRAMAVALAGTTLLGAGLWHQHHRISPVPAKPVTQKADALPKGISEATLADIRNSLEKQEYHISYDEQKKKLQSPNRRNNIRAYYEPGKLTVQTRVDTTGDGFKMELVNEGVFADGKLLYAPEMAARAEHHENKVQISHQAFTEEFINNEEGVRQNFIIENAPEDTRQLQVKLAAKGLEVEQGSGNELHFYSKTANDQTRNELVYSDLKCWDANKKPLNATLAYVDNRIQISVDVAGAAYPVTIDPIIANGTPQNANKVIQIDQTSMHLGWSVSSAGDVNGDGYSDVIVGAPDYDFNKDAEGGAFVYKGDPSGLTLTAVTFKSNQTGAKMGYSVASAGDFNGDGFSDVIVGIPYYDKDAVDDGQANLYLGSGTFFSSPITAYSFGNGHAGALMGINVATAGDINGDGFSDVLIGATQDGNGQNKEGRVAVCYGSSNGNLYSNKLYLEIDQPNAQFGYSLAPAGDIDADGYSDIIIGARWYTNGQGQDAEGAAFIYRGNGSGQLANPVVIEGNQYNAAMGNKVSSAGDVNGDGYSDVLISAYLYDLNVANQKDHGIVNLYLGSSTGISSQQQPSRTFYGKDNDHMGSSIACAGDVNGDGYSDILLGAEHYDNGQFNEGGVFVYYGSQGSVGIVGEPVATMESNQADGWFGTAISSAGDVNGDGYSDILIGCYTFDNGQKDEGHVFVYHGGAEGIGTDESGMITNSKTGAQMGLSVAGAGDVNGDGYDDVVIGAPYFDDGQSSEGVAFVYHGSITGLTTNVYNSKLQKDQANSYFGGSVAGPGDVNGDGYDDILVSAKEYTNGENNEGLVFFYPGSPSGINQNANPYILQENKANADYGFAVSGAGDVNRDGYADIIVGAPTYSAEGDVFVYLGGPNGPASPKHIFGSPNPGSINLYFGSSVSSAGDVNGDGYADVIIGAPGSNFGEQGEGTAHIFHGSSSGIDLNFKKTLQINQVDSNLGCSVASAGDVNGDGYSDVIVGARLFDNNESNEGVAIVYYGTISGVNDVIPAPTFLEANVSEAYFGSSVNSTGDVNGDGYSDVIVGAPNFTNGQSKEGKAFVYHGSPNGVKTVSSFGIESDLINGFMGRSVSGAGDVNGDGYSDILVGAIGYDNGQALDVGATYVYYGNNGKGLRNNVRLYNASTSTPINHNNFSAQKFGMGLFAKSFLGSSKGQLAMETQTCGSAFYKIGNTPITNSTLFTDIYDLHDLSSSGSELTANRNKAGISTKVRARVRYSPVLAITGQMYGPWRYVQRQLSGYNNAPVPEEAMAETIKRKTEPEVETSVSIFPNPASDRLSIQVTDPSDIRGVRLYNTSGTPVFQSQRYEKDIDVSKLPGGVYILMLNRASGTSTSHRILIRR